MFNNSECPNPVRHSDCVGVGLRDILLRGGGIDAQSAYGTVSGWLIEVIGKHPSRPPSPKPDLSRFGRRSGCPATSHAPPRVSGHPLLKTAIFNATPYTTGHCIVVRLARVGHIFCPGGSFYTACKSCRARRLNKHHQNYSGFKSIFKASKRYWVFSNCPARGNGKARMSRTPFPRFGCVILLRVEDEKEKRSPIGRHGTTSG